MKTIWLIWNYVYSNASTIRLSPFPLVRQFPYNYRLVWLIAKSNWIAYNSRSSFVFSHFFRVERMHLRLSVRLSSSLVFVVLSCRKFIHLRCIDLHYVCSGPEDEKKEEIWKEWGMHFWIFVVVVDIDYAIGVILTGWGRKC